MVLGHIRQQPSQFLRSLGRRVGLRGEHLKGLIFRFEETSNASRQQRGLTARGVKICEEDYCQVIIQEAQKVSPRCARVPGDPMSSDLSQSPPKTIELAKHDRVVAVVEFSRRPHLIEARSLQQLSYPQFRVPFGQVIKSGKNSIER